MDFGGSGGAGGNGGGGRPFSFASLVPSLVSAPRRKLWRPGTFNPLIIILAILTMYGLAIGLEIALFFSTKWQGFPLAPGAGYDFGSVQFLKSFLPTVVTTLLVLLWSKQYEWLRLLQPYVALSNGSATADRSVTADYVTLNRIKVLRMSYKKKDWIVFLAGIVTVMNMALDPLAGSVFLVRTLAKENTNPPSVTITKSLGVDNSFRDYSPFVAAAGFAEAAVFHRLPDPPFVKDNFTITEFEFPKERYLNGTLILRTSGIQTTLNCFLPDAGTLSVRTQTGRTSIDLRAKWNGCDLATSINITNELARLNQYGAVSAWPCTPPTSVSGYLQNDHKADVTNDRLLQPVMFWFWKPQSMSGEGQTYDPDKSTTRVVTCAPTIQVHEVDASANLTTNSLESVKIIREWQWGSAGGPRVNNLAGQGAFNGVLFNPSSNPFIQARATAVTGSLPETIFKFATRDIGAERAFANETTFLDATVKVYAQHLAIVAKSVYYSNENRSVKPTLVTMETRLWVDPRAAHSLALLFIISATLVTVAFLWYRREAKRLRLPQQPGTIAYTAAILNSHAGQGGQFSAGGPNSKDGYYVAPGLEWTTTLSPSDDENMIAMKLRGLLFGLDASGRVIAHTRTRDPAPGPGGNNPYPFGYGFGSTNVVYDSDGGGGGGGAKERELGDAIPLLGVGQGIPQSPGPGVASFPSPIPSPGPTAAAAHHPYPPPHPTTGGGGGAAVTSPTYGS